jgi:hypothetical protein
MSQGTDGLPRLGHIPGQLNTNVIPNRLTLAAWIVAAAAAVVASGLLAAELGRVRESLGERELPEPDPGSPRSAQRGMFGQLYEERRGAANILRANPTAVAAAAALLACLGAGLLLREVAHVRRLEAAQSDSLAHVRSAQDSLKQVLAALRDSSAGALTAAQGAVSVPPTPPASRPAERPGPRRGPKANARARPSASTLTRRLSRGAFGAAGSVTSVPRSGPPLMRRRS